MIEKAFKDLKSRSLVDWGVVLLGVQAAFGADVGRLSGELVEDFATRELAVTQPGDSEFEAIAALALDSSLPAEELEQIVGTICRIKGVDIELSRRKWRAALVADSLSEIDSNPLYGFIQLSEIWSKWGWPDDGPQLLRRGAEASLRSEFGSPEAFLLAKQEAEAWLASEYASLKLK
jgi:hypothetical protein